MAGVTGDETGVGETRIEVELLAQLDHAQVDGLRRTDRGDGLVLDGTGGGAQADGGGEGRERELRKRWRKRVSQRQCSGLGVTVMAGHELGQGGPISAEGFLVGQLPLTDYGPAIMRGES